MPLSADFILQRLKTLYRKELNFEIRCFFDAGWEWKLGDRDNGFKDGDHSCRSFDQAVEELWESARKHYPKAFGKGD